MRKQSGNIVAGRQEYRQEPVPYTHRPHASSTGPNGITYIIGLTPLALFRFYTIHNLVDGRGQFVDFKFRHIRISTDIAYVIFVG